MLACHIENGIEKRALIVGDIWVRAQEVIPHLEWLANNLVCRSIDYRNILKKKIISLITFM